MNNSTFIHIMDWKSMRNDTTILNVMDEEQYFVLNVMNRNMITFNHITGWKRIRNITIILSIMNKSRTAKYVLFLCIYNSNASCQ